MRRLRRRCRSSARLPDSTVRPSRMIVTRSARRSTSLRMWLDSSTVVPAATRSATHAANTCSISGSSPEVGSSSTSRSTSAAKRRDQRDLLPVALGVGPAPPGRVEPEAFQQLLAAPVARVGAAHAQQQVDRLAARQVGPQGDVAGHVGQPAVDGDAVAPGVEPEDAGGAAVAAQQAQQCPERGGLARAVRAEEAVHLAAPHREVQAVQGPDRPEALDQAANLDHERCRRPHEPSIGPGAQALRTSIRTDSASATARSRTARRGSGRAATVRRRSARTAGRRSSTSSTAAWSPPVTTSEPRGSPPRIRAAWSAAAS